MNKRIVLSSMSIFASLALVTGATFAFFSDVGTSNDNVFAAGDLTLQLDDDNEPTFATNDDTVTASFGASDMAPGDSVTDFVSLHNGGSIDIAEIELGANKTAGDDALADELHLTVLTGADSACTGGTDHTSAINTQIGGGVGPLTLAELIAADYDALPGLAVGADSFMCLTTEFDATAGDALQGTSITVDVVFTAHQDASQ
ncbi:MAG: TasA family protein [Patescibacteria group bacterium]